MRSARIIAALSFSWILLGTAALLAQGQDQMPPMIMTDRPAVTDASTVVPIGALVMENGFAETASQGQRSFDFPESLFRFGVSSKKQNFVSTFPIISTTTTAEPSSALAGEILAWA